MTAQYRLAAFARSIRQGFAVLGCILIWGCSPLSDAASNRSVTASPADEASVPSSASSANATGLGGGPTNLIILKNPGSSALSDVPVQFGRVFREGAHAKCVTPVVDGKAASGQVTVKNRWPDGSLKFAVVSIVLPRLEGRSSASVTFSGSAECEPPKSVDGRVLLQEFPDYEVAVRLNDGASGMASARMMIEAGAFRVWESGPEAITLIVADHTAKRFDFGPGVGQPLRPVFHVTFWRNSKQVRTRVILEQSDNTKLQNVSYSVQITSGRTQPRTDYNRSAVPHAYATRWTRVVWSGVPPVQLDEVHGVGYLASTFAIPNFDSRVALDRAAKDSLLNLWAQAPKDIYDAGLFQKYMGMGGGRAEIGLFSSWTVAALYDGDARLWNMVKRNADLAGAWPMHFREGDGARAFTLRPARVPGIGLPMSKDGRPGAFLYDGNAYIGQYNLPEDRLTPIGPIDLNGWTHDCSHQPDEHYPLYLVTGDPWYLEQLQFWASWGLFLGNPGYAPRPVDSPVLSDGLKDAVIEDQVRGEAWCLRTRARAAYASVDESPEKDYFTRVTNSALSIWLGRKIGAGNGSDPIRVNWRRWAEMYRSSELAANPLRYWKRQMQPEIKAADVAGSTSPWMDHFMLMSLGHVRELGFEVGELFSWYSQWAIGMATTPGLDPRHLADYRFPSQKLLPNEPFFTTWNDAVDDWTTWTSQWEYFAPDLTHGYTNIATAALSFAAGQTNGAAAWKWVHDNNYRSQNWALNPKWAILPR